MVVATTPQLAWAVPTEKELALMEMAVKSIRAWHFTPTDINDELSEKSHKQFINSLDPNKRFFTKSDLKELKEHVFKIDDQMLNERSDFFEDAIALYQKRIAFIKSNYESLLSRPFTFDKNHLIQTNSDKKSPAKDERALLIQWQKELKFYTLNNAISLVEDKVGTDNSISAKEALALLSPEIEQGAREKTRNSITRQLKRLSEKTREDYFFAYINAIVQTQDPHTNYFPPADKENFDIGMTGRLEGIGAMLSEDDGQIKVSKIVPGSASYRQKELEAEDVILKVTQKNTGDTIEVTEMPVHDAVKYIRGPKGSTVILTVKKPDGMIKDIPIVRDVVVIEESYAKAALITPKESKQTFGYIYLPSFYRDFSNKNARNAGDDVGNLLDALSAEKVKGIILDLRNNGGGSLLDAVDITGHFIRMGPVVQVKNRNEHREVRYDLNPSIKYEGPLVVLINKFSASASEILAAALQDYHRAIIVGTETSFGKGTVQTFIDFDEHLQPSYFRLKPMGSIKMTVQQFYRINGSSTQFKGVHSDIVIPTTTDYIEVGESTLDNAIPWDQVSSKSFNAWSRQKDINQLKKRSKKRMAKHHGFQTVSNYTNQLKVLNEQESPLGFIESWERKKTIKDLNKSLENLGTIALKNAEISPIFSGKTIAKNIDQDRRKEWIKNIHKDIAIEEALAILSDIIGAPYDTWAAATTTP